MTACRYFDGSSSRAWPASASVDGGALRIVADGVDRIVDRAALAFVPPQGVGPARIAFATGGSCEFEDRPGAAALFAALGHCTAAADRMVARVWQVVAVTLLFVVVVAALYVWGIPAVADRLVEQAPRTMDEAFGGPMLRTLDARGVFRPSSLPQPTQDRLWQRFVALAEPVQGTDGLHLNLLFRKLGVPNALALPGGTIVLTDEIVELAGDDDAIATVIAHEIGHQVHRDAMRQLARSTISSALAFWYLGDVSNAAAVAAGSFGSLRYTRDAEHQADLYAVDAMRAQHASTHSAADLFRRLETWSPKRPDAPTSAAQADRRRLRFPEYLSTHPDTADRIRLFDDDDGH